MTRHAPVGLLRFLHLRRRTLAALCAFAAVWAILAALAPARVTTVAVFAATRDLPAGTVLAAEHVAPVEVADSQLPGEPLVEAGEVIGRVLSGPVTERSLLTAASVSTGQRLARDGHVVVALPLPTSGIGSLVRPGARLDVFDGQGELIASDVVVIAPPETAGGGGFGLGGPSGAALVEVPHSVAERLASIGPAGVSIAVR